MSAVYTVNRDGIISAALRTLGVIGAGDQPTPVDYQNCAEALNIYIKQLQTKGLPLWKLDTVIVPMVVGQKIYTIGPNIGSDVITDKPLRVVMAFIRNPQGNDTVLQQMARQQYMQLGVKTSQGVPNQFYYDPKLDTGYLYVYNVPSGTDYNIHLQVQMPIADVSNPTSTPEFPSEWFNCLKFGLADNLSLEYGASAQVRAELAQKAMKLEEIMTDWSQEEASTSFAPEFRFRAGY
jgi:hypothetical protein